MPEFTYQARNSAGKQVTGTVTASNESDALGELRKQNLVVVSLTEKAGKKAASGGGGGGGGWNIDIFGAGGGNLASKAKRARVKLQDMIVFTRQLATMLSAGIPLLECLEILSEQAEDAGFRAVITIIVDDVRSGSDFSDALRKHPRVFSNIYVNMIKAGEASGQLDEILTRLAEYNEATAKLRGEIKAAMTYPIVSLFLILAITIGLLVFIIPKFADIFASIQDSHGNPLELPRPTKILMAVSDFMSNQWYIGLAIIAAVYFGIGAYGRTPTGRRHLDWMILKAPVFGPLFRKVAISRFARTFATLIQSGVPILGALEIVASTAGNRIIEDAVMEAATSVRQGDTLAAPLLKSGVMPPMVCRMIAIGEKSGALESLLEKISEFYDQQVSTSVESLTSLIEPIMIAVMGFLVGGMVLAIFLPIFKIASALKG